MYSAYFAVKNSVIYLLANSPLVSQITYANGSATRMTTSKTYDYLNRLTQISSAPGAAGLLPLTYTYNYNLANQRTLNAFADGSHWAYQYDALGQVTSGKRYWADGTAVAGEQFGYAYDNIGNRLTAAFGGDTNGLNLRTNTYTANSLNEYTGIQTPGYESILGAALANSSVTVNGSVADREGEYFHREIPVANGSGPVWQNATNISSTFTNRGGLLVPAATQTITNDADGNLTADGIWTYQWDAENRLIMMAMTPSVSGIASSNVLRLDFSYDYLGRRVQKVVSTWNGTGFTPQTTSLFVYDGWNLLAVVNSQTAIQQSFMWGSDLSGTTTKAGGVGGLLMASISSTNCFPTYDGNGNFTSLLNIANKSLAARYEYDTFGNILRETGLLARSNPFRFSTKFADDESGNVYYNARYYNPSFGKWIGRDPTTDQILLNLYLFCHNNPIGRVDGDGKVDLGDVLVSCFIQGSIGAGVGAGARITSNAINGVGLFDNVANDDLAGAVTGAILGGVMANAGKGLQLFLTNVSSPTGIVLGTEEGEAAASAFGEQLANAMMQGFSAGLIAGSAGVAVSDIILGDF